MKSMYKENMCVRNTVVKVRNKEYTDNENDSICADASADVKLRQHSFCTVPVPVETTGKIQTRILRHLQDTAAQK